MNQPEIKRGDTFTSRSWGDVPAKVLTTSEGYAMMRYPGKDRMPFIISCAELKVLWTKVEIRPIAV